MSPSGSEYINAAIRALPGAPVHRVDASLHRLQWNENPFDYPDDLKEEVLQRLARVPWSRYPLGVRAYDLMDALGRFYSLPAEATVVGNGSSDLLRIGRRSQPATIWSPSPPPSRPIAVMHS
jgi:histidinol-phosphate aminotransferase